MADWNIYFLLTFLPFFSPVPLFSFSPSSPFFLFLTFTINITIDGQYDSESRVQVQGEEHSTRHAFRATKRNIQVVHRGGQYSRGKDVLHWDGSTSDPDVQVWKGRLHLDRGLDLIARYGWLFVRWLLLSFPFPHVW